ncbi:hypothetical protein PsorP6_013412 [Peronosclerospora sorghi]|uniref:Uncharacterized protein n=1 Tax=Peronosclerospora sorghi TaxID=230839 RepID=A0ACC0VJ54_9STRA|nr:hypothetical protein PsorP6_013412 [Peronosclerospora sorghi]
MKAFKREEVSELSGDDLFRAVQVVRDDTTGSWWFPVMCSRTSSLRDAGVMKTGKCTWFPPTQLRIQCSCCTKVMNPIEFVHHTDTCLIPSPSAARNESMQYLLVEH